MRAIDGTRLKEYLTCPRLPFLSFHQPRDVELPPTARMEILFRSGYRIEERILAEIDPEVVSFPGGDLEAGCRATLELMQRGVPAIAGGVLKLGEFLGRPDLLLWDGDSQRYEVADVKSSQKVHASALIQVAFYSRLLGQIREVPRRGSILVRDGTRVPFAVADCAASVEHLLVRISAFRSDRASDPGPHLQEACLDCRYRELCLADLEAADHLSLTPGVTRAQAAALAAAGIDSARALGEIAKFADVARATGLPLDLVRRLSRRAQAVGAGRPLRQDPPRSEFATASFALSAVLAERLTEPAVAIAGLVLANHDLFRARFLRPAEAVDPDANLREFLANLSATRGPILVFGTDVTRLLDAVADRLPGGPRAVDQLRRRCLDLRAELGRTVALPGFSRTPRLAAQAAGLEVPDQEVELAALRYLEGEDGADQESLERLLREDLASIARLRDFVLAGPEGER